MISFNQSTATYPTNHSSQNPLPSSARKKKKKRSYYYNYNPNNGGGGRREQANHHTTLSLSLSPSLFLAFTKHTLPKAPPPRENLRDMKKLRLGSPSTLFFPTTTNNSNKRTERSQYVQGGCSPPSPKLSLQQKKLIIRQARSSPSGTSTEGERAAAKGKKKRPNVGAIRTWV